MRAYKGLATLANIGDANLEDRCFEQMYGVPSRNPILMVFIVDVAGEDHCLRYTMHISSVDKVWVRVCMVNVDIMADCSKRVSIQVPGWNLRNSMKPLYQHDIDPMVTSRWPGVSNTTPASRIEPPIQMRPWYFRRLQLLWLL